MSNQELHFDDRQRAFQQLIEFLKLPNDTIDRTAIEQNCTYLEDAMRAIGMRVERLEAGGAPYLYGEHIIDATFPTLLIYSHYDGVPVEPAKWDSPPYEPSLKIDGLPVSLSSFGEETPDTARLYARSVADSKNAISAVLFAYERVSSRRGLKVNVKLLFDGEEERESPSMETMLENYASKLDADIFISASGEVHQSGFPTVAFGVRGALTLELTVHTAIGDLHSGHFGNFAPNAALKLARLLAELKDEHGKVSIPGFYDHVKRLNSEEQELVERVPHVESEIQQLFGISNQESTQGALQDLINQPTLNIRGLHAGYLGRDARNIIPSRATASMDIRLNAGMQPERIKQLIRNWLAAAGWQVGSEPPDVMFLREHDKVMELKFGEGFPATKSNASGSHADYIIEAVRQASWSDRVVIEPTEGGSLKHYLFKELGMSYAALPSSNFDNNQHTHNENLELRYYWYGIRLFEQLFQSQPKRE